MKRAVALAATLAGLASVCAGAAPQLAAAPVVTGKSSPVLDKRAAVPPPDVVERLKKVGLDPKDPNFAARLKALAAQSGPAYVRSHVVSNAPTAIRKATVGRPPVAKPGHSTVSSQGPRIAGELAHVNGTIQAFVYDVDRNPVVLNSTALSSPLPYALIVVTDRKINISESGSVSLTLGCAGLTFTENALVLATDDPGFNGTSWFFPSSVNVHPYYVWPVNFPPFPIGQERRGTISISFDNVSASTSAGFLPTEGTVTIDVTIDQTPSATGFGSVSPWGSTGLTAGNATLKDPGAPRVGSGDWSTTVQGNDTVGDGVQLGPGWKVTSVTVKSALSASAPQDTSPDNSWRGAKVTLQPQAGSLRTGVAWHYSGIDTLDYTVEWTLTGPLGRRPILTMAKHDSCDN